MKIKLLIGLVVVLVPLLAYLFLLPGPIDSVAWQPPPILPMDGHCTPNNRLNKAEIVVSDINGPEDVAIDKDGFIYGGTQEGKIIRAKAGGPKEVFAVTKGRPLGLHFDQRGNLIVCDAWKGLLSISPQRTVDVLCTEADGLPFAFTNDLDIASDGTIYFSDASSKFNQPQYMDDALESRPWGRLLSYSPKTKKVRVLAKELYFANGIALSQKEDFLICCETWRYRILRYWLKGKQKGKLEVFARNLPGFPDGVASDRKGTFWLALPTTRNKQLDSFHPNKSKKDFLAKLPKFLKPKPKKYGLVIALNESGQVIKSLHDVDGAKLSEITSVQPHGSYLYFGTLHGQKIGRLKLSTND